MTKDELIKEEEHLFNTFVIVNTQVYKYLGVEEDEEDIYRVFDTLDEEVPIIWISAICKIVVLKDVLPEEDYNFIDNIWTLNSKGE